MKHSEDTEIKFSTIIRCTTVNKKTSVHVKNLELLPDDILTVEYSMRDESGAANGQYASYIHLTNNRNNNHIVVTRNTFFRSIVPTVFEFIQE